MAIAFDNAYAQTIIGSAATSFSYTCGVGASLIVITGPKYTSLKYNGVSMSNIANYTSPIVDGNGQVINVWWLANPTSGSNLVDGTIAFLDNEAVTVVSYTGMNSSGQPDVSNGQTANNGTNNTQVVGLSTNITTLTDNSWVIMGTKGSNNAPRTFVSGAGTLRCSTGSIFTASMSIIDSNGPISPAGNISLTANWSSGSGFMANFVMAFKPFQAPAFTPQMLII